MKKLFCIAVIALLTTGAFAQGVFTFANSSATAITNQNTGARSPLGEVLVGLYGSTTLGLGQTPNDSSLTLIGNAAPLSGSAGRFNDGQRFFGNPGQVVTLQVRAWAASFATWDTAVAAGALRGKSLAWEETAGGGIAADAPITGVNTDLGNTPRLQAFTVVPEPSSIALGLLGLGAVALIRRRK